MSTAVQILVNLALLGRKDKPQYHWPIIIGALFADVPLYLFYLFEKANKTPATLMWNNHYERDEWQALFAMFNSLPLIVIGGLFAYVYKAWKWLAFALSLLVHALFNLLLQGANPVKAFWPMNDTSFQNPIKYFHVDYYGANWGSIEIGIMVVAGFFVYKLAKHNEKHRAAKRAAKKTAAKSSSKKYTTKKKTAPTKKTTKKTTSTKKKAAPKSTTKKTATTKKKATTTKKKTTAKKK